MTSTAPMVRIVVLTFDGGELTLDCLASIDALDWPRDRLEVVLVDNGSLDDVAERVRATMPWVTVVEPLRNLGFAGGCNLGITHEVGGTLSSRFDYVALVNNDATLDPTWLHAVIAQAGPDIGGVASKMLFHERYQRVRLEVLDAIEGSRRDQLGVCVSAVRLDGERCDDRLLFDEGFHGPVAPDIARDEEIAVWSRADGELRIVAGDEPARHVQLRCNAKHPLRVRVDGGAGAVECGIGADGETAYSEIDLDVAPDAVDLVNNVGSELYEWGFAGDRGFMAIDDGTWETPTECFSWCGGAVLLSAAHLDEVGLFDESLFLYYEDTELSWRARRRGWRHVVAPAAVVRHRHASSSGVGSDVFRYYTERNRLLVAMAHAPARTVLGACVLEVRHAARVHISHLVLRPLRLQMPARIEPRHRRRVLVGVLRGAPAMLRRRWSRGATVRRGAITRRWQMVKWS